MSVDLEPCTSFSWCWGHMELDTDLDHQGVVATVRAGDSEVTLGLYLATDGTSEFSVDMGDWTFDTRTIDSEVIELHNIVDQLHSAMLAALAVPSSQ